MPQPSLIARIAQVSAANAAAHATVLAGQDPTWGSEVVELAGGWAVLCGPGLFVNAALGLGLSGPVTEPDLAVLEKRSAAVGVPPAIESVPAAHPSLTALASARGYTTQQVTRFHALPLHRPLPTPPALESIRVETVSSELVPLWQDVAAEGTGSIAGIRRRASDAFARAVSVNDQLLLARDSRDGRPLGCASLTIRDGIATLGGM